MRKLVVAGIVAAAAALAQTAQTGSISGVVRDAVTGSPLPEITVSTYLNGRVIGGIFTITGDSKQVTAKTDSQGRYKLGDLPPGLYRVLAMREFSERFYRMVNLRPAQELTSIDFRFAANGVISGKVVDENKEPVADITVFLVGREYGAGGLRALYKGAATTNDKGEYTIERVEPGRAYLLLAEKRDRNLPAVSDAPANPKLRKPVVVPTWYPNAPTIDGGASLVLRPGERRDGVDIRIAKVAAYCTEGTAEGPAGPAPLSFWIESQQASSGMSRDSGMYTATAGGKTGDDGKFRICGLRPGQYRLTTLLVSGAPAGVDPVYGMTPVTIVDEDVRGVKALARLGMTIPGEVVWDGAAPEKPVNAQLWLTLRPMTRSPIPGERGSSPRVDIPGQFTLPHVFLDDYSLWRVSVVNSPGLYVKDVTYGGVSVLHEPLRVGSMIGNQGLRVIVGHDGGTLSTQVADKDGNPIGDAHLVVIPANAASEAMVSQTMILGETNQDGLYSTPSLAPGKYYVLAVNAPVDDSPECIGRLWRARTKAKVVEIGPHATAQAALTPGSID